MATVKELREQLEALERIRIGNCVLWFRDCNEIDWPVDFGIMDTNENNVVLG